MNKTQRIINVFTWLALLVVLAPAATAQAMNGEKLEATAWAVADSDGGSYIFNFGRGGKISLTSSSGTSGGGTWRQVGGAVRIEVNKGFVEYNGTIEGLRMEGRAKNRRGREWRWWGVKQEASPIESSPAFPKYPSIAVAARAEGVVTVDVQVNSTGQVISAVAVAGHPLLQQAGVEAAKRWKFIPGGDAGTPRAARLLFTFRVVPQDCVKRYPDPAPALISAYQAEVRRRSGCIDFSAEGDR